LAQPKILYAIDTIGCPIFITINGEQESVNGDPEGVQERVRAFSPANSP
jgi:hypothetical protein